MNGREPAEQVQPNFGGPLSTLALTWRIRLDRAARRARGRPLRDPCNFCGISVWGQTEHGMSCHDGWICDRCLDRATAQLVAHDPTLPGPSCSFCYVRRGAAVPVLGGRGGLLLCAVCVAEYEPPSPA